MIDGDSFDPCDAPVERYLVSICIVVLRPGILVGLLPRAVDNGTIAQYYSISLADCRNDHVCFVVAGGDRLDSLEYQLQYAELMINLYDNIITLVTHGSDEQYIKEEAILRLQENKEKLAAYEIQSPVLGVSNGVVASGVAELVEQLATQSLELVAQE